MTRMTRIFKLLFSGAVISGGVYEARQSFYLYSRYIAIHDLLMKKLFLFFAFTMVFVSCKGELNQINVVFPHNMELGTHVHDLKISSQDTVIKIYRGKHSFFFAKGDTLTFSGLRSGDYTMTYLDLLGKTKSKNITLKGGDTLFVMPKPLDVDVKAFYDKTPISNLKEGEGYEVWASGPHSGPMHTIYRSGNKFYYQGYNEEKRLLTNEKIGYVKQFEAELLAIQGVDSFILSSGNWYYYIVKNNDTLRLVDNTGMWRGWQKWYPKIRK
jgi:hypothetical protein